MKRFTVLLAFLLFAFTAMQAQSVQITGNVTSADDGSPLPGVSVVVKGTTVGTVTDFNGDYVLAVPRNATTLVFSFVGMKTQEVAIGGQTTISVAMASDALNLDEVVVTALGISREKKALGFAMSTVASDEIEKSRTPNVVNALSGKVAGVRVISSSGSAGAATFIEIRGSASLTRDNRPLFVIDGVPIVTGGGVGAVDGVDVSDRALDINPEDIETMSVLKGGAATALYGLRASNGAIVITTKKGSAGKSQVSFSSSVTFEKVSQLPERQDMFSQGRAGGWRNPTTGESLSWGARLDTLRYTKNPAAFPGTLPAATYIEKWDPNGWIVGQSNPLADQNALVKPYDPYEFFQTGVTYNNNLALSGGTDKSTLYLSLNHLNQTGIVPNNTYERFNVKVSADHKFTDKLSIGSNINMSYSDANRTQKGSNVSGLMLGLLRTPPTFDNAYGYIFPDQSQRNYRGGAGYDNPYWTVNKNTYKDPVHRMFGDIHASYNPLEWLSFSYRLGVDWYNRYATDHLAKFSRAYPSGSFNTFNEFSRDLNSDLLMNISKSINEDLDFSLTLGNNMYSSYYEYTQAYADGLTLLDFPSLSNTTTNLGYNGVNQKRTMAFFGQVDLNYRKMIYLSGTLRNEMSTTLPKENNSFIYPSGSFGFVFTELAGLKDNSILPYGKLRASYAVTAQDASLYRTDNYYYVGNFGDGWTTGTYFPYGGVNGYSYTDELGNAGLKPEKMKTFEVGAELKFVNNRINLDVTYFQNVNEDLLLSVPIASSTGFGSQYMNAAKMTTTGMEVILGLDVVKSSGFNWNITTNFSNPKTVVDELAEGVDNLFLGGFVGSQIRAVAGQTYRSVYATTYVRDAEGRLMINPTGTFAGYPVTGDVMEYIGDVSEKWRMGLNNTFSFKGITLSALLEVKNGGKMWNGTRGAMDYFGTSATSAQRQATDLKVFEGVYGYLDTRTNEVVYTDALGNDLATGATPVSNTQQVIEDRQNWMVGPGSGFTGPAEFYVEDAGYIRLREVVLSYDLPKSLLGSTPFDALNVYFSGRNLWLKTDYSGVDPDTNLLGASNAQGIDYFNNPGTKSFTFGLKVAF